MKVRAFYWIFPALAATSWLVCLIGLLGLWATSGHDHFSGSSIIDGQRREKFTNSVYISDIGAEHQHFFIAFCVLTGAFYITTVMIERHLRHERHIPGSTHIRTSWFDTVSLIAAIAGSIGLIMLSIFNTFAHGSIHWSMTALFIAGALISVLFQTIMLFDLSRSHDHVAAAAKQLLLPAVIKLSIFVLAIAIAIAFACLYMSCRGEKYFEKEHACNLRVSGAAGCEWTIAFLLIPYLLLYVYDFWPARKDHDAVAAEGWTTKASKEQRPYGQPFYADSSYYVPQASLDSPTTPYPEKLSGISTPLSPSTPYSPRPGEGTSIDMPGFPKVSSERVAKSSTFFQLIRSPLSTNTLSPHPSQQKPAHV